VTAEDAPPDAAPDTAGAVAPGGLTIVPIGGIGEVTAGVHLDTVVGDALDAAARDGRLPDGLCDHDVVVVTSKIVSKAEGAVVTVDEADPAAKAGVVASQARRVLRRRGDLVITETHHGLVCANAGVDLSNTAPGTAVLLPEDPDRAARGLRDRLAARFGRDRLGVVVSDTFGRAWRNGLCDVAIGVAGFAPLQDLRGTTDAQGRALDVTQLATADAVATAADLVMGKASGVPVAVVRGLHLVGDGVAADLIRPAADDLFR
jgi:coenzyme F420-0:L-glutamate ligase/coenzyme F420-1:gamma-L-glutamate ligase